MCACLSNRVISCVNVLLMADGYMCSSWGGRKELLNLKGEFNSWGSTWVHVTGT